MSDQKVVLVTAGSAGVGAAVARAFAPDHRVVINFANNAGRANDLVEELYTVRSLHPNPEEPRFTAIPADVGSKTAVEELVTQTVAAMGRLDVVVSNAGWTRVTNFNNLEEGLLEEDWDKCFLYNVKSHLWLFTAAKPHLEAKEGREGGAFITTASMAGIKPQGSSLPYAVTKAAQIHLAKSLAAICGPSGIRVNSIGPGLLMTEWGKKFPQDKIDGATKQTKLGRLAVVEDVAIQVKALAMSKSITGQNILIDGGASL